jgi:Na+-transporting NADH:ubiquinone oxidoreductase subunit C
MKKRLFSILYMFLVTLFFTSVVSAVKFYNEDRIAMNQKVKMLRVVLHILRIPVQEGASPQAVAQVFAERVKEIEVRERPLYIGYAEDGETISGYAFPVSGQGFWGPIIGLAAVDPSAAELLGVAFFRHSETPGLGARITEERFTGQFRGLPLYPIEEEDKIFYLKAEGTGQAENELDAITGATGTSRAVEAFLNRELDYFLEAIWPEVKRKG